MKLYYVRGTGSLSAHIALHESGLDFQAIEVSTKTHLLPNGNSYFDVNPLGYVPLLELGGGERLREGAVIVQYVADQVPAKSLSPPHGSMARYRMQEWLNFVGTELHKGLSPLVNLAMPEQAKELAKAHTVRRLNWVEAELAGREWLLGDAYSVADGYLFAVVLAAKRLGIDLAAMPRLRAWCERMVDRPAVQLALRAEGLTT